jgi:outer membrane lipoprotein carrier protein
MLRLILLPFAFVALTLSANTGHSADDLRRSLETRYQHAHTLKALFFERYSDGSGGVTAESGTVYFSRPGRMRWEYESPEQKLFLVDGTNAWFYVPADHTASRAKLKESSDWRTPIALLAGSANLSKLCRSIEIVDVSHQSEQSNGKSNGKSNEDQPSPGDTVLRCIPRDTSGDSGQEVLLEMDSESHLVRVVIRQPGNAETEFRFGNWEENIPVPEDKFHFVPPPGVAIVDQQSLSGEIR